MFQEWFDEIELDRRDDRRIEVDERENARRDWRKKEMEEKQKQRELIESMMADTIALREHNLQEAHGGR